MDMMDYKSFYNRVGEQNGWDFSKLKFTVKGKKWDYQDEVLKLINERDIFLDIGTGGGEKALSIAEHLTLLIGIDQSPNMIKTAHLNLSRTSINNCKFFEMDANNIVFPGDFFNVISCRHSHFDAGEVYRLLVDGGVFITQQVCQGDKINIKKVFNRGETLSEEDGNLQKRYIKELQEAGFTQVSTYEYDATEYYERPEDLIFLLKHTPIIPNFGENEEDFELLNEYILRNQTEYGIETNSKRFMIIARK
ncbi:class I SAM-dependent methyltransferase [Bacillus cereus]|uniref:class I SAM-dependent methyltransferase n=1 Tax=Bacillus cereus TaxID=1396 RepID=UPI003D016FFB